MAGLLLLPSQIHRHRTALTGRGHHQPQQCLAELKAPTPVSCVTLPAQVSAVVTVTTALFSVRKLTCPVQVHLVVRDPISAQLLPTVQFTTPRPKVALHTPVNSANAAAVS